MGAALDELAGAVVDAVLHDLGHPARVLARARLELAVHERVELHAHELEAAHLGVAVEREAASVAL